MKLTEEEEKHVEDFFAELEEPLEEEAKALKTIELKYQFNMDKLQGEWKEEIVKFKDHKIIKFRKLF